MSVASQLRKDSAMRLEAVDSVPRLAPGPVPSEPRRKSDPILANGLPPSVAESFSAWATIPAMP